MTHVDYPCPLCGTAALFAEGAAGRPIHCCPACDLRFVPAAFHLSPEQERARYDLHRNSLSDAGYVRFLSPAVDALRRLLPPASGPTVLDYGSGPDPVLVELLRREGYDACGYDPYYPSGARLRDGYDAVVSTEVFEHFRLPADEIERVVQRVGPGGLLVVMTSLYTGQRLAAWHYALDTTHICFYSAATFGHIARIWNLRLVETDTRRLLVLRRSG